MGLFWPFDVSMTAQKRDELRDMKTDSTLTRDPEIAALTRYYEHDGMLRAYANRAMFLALLFGVIAIGSLGFAIYVRVHPPRSFVSIKTVRPLW